MPLPPRPEQEEMGVEDGDPDAARRITFHDVDEIASIERRRAHGGNVEPPEITMLRMQAAEEAQQLVGQALLQAQIIEQEAREQGYRTGYDKGYADGQSQATQVVMVQAEAERQALRDDMTMFLTHVEAERQHAWEEMEPQIIGMVFDLARQVIKQEVEASHIVALSVIKNALRRVADSGTLRIRVNSADLDTVRSHRAELLSLLDGIPHLEIVEDRRVGAGGCVVDTDAGSIDARLETQIKEVGDTLEQMIARPESEA